MELHRPACYLTLGEANRGLVQFQRLREDGPLYAAIAAAVDRGGRQGSTGNRSLRRRLSGTPPNGPWRLWGWPFARLREDGVILRGLKAALDDAVKAGEVIRKAGMVSLPPG